MTNNPAGAIEFELVSAPFTGEPTYAPPFYEALGRILFLWGRCEYMFDQNLRMAFGIAQSCGHDHRPRNEFARKIDLMRKILRECEPLASLAKAADPILAELFKVGHERNLVVHSHYEKFQDGNPPCLRLRNSRIKNNSVHVRKGTFSLAELQKIADRINRAIPAQLGLRMKLTEVHNVLARAHRASSK